MYSEVPHNTAYVSLSEDRMNSSHYPPHHVEYDPYHDLPTPGTGKDTSPRYEQRGQPPVLHSFTLFLTLVWIAFTAALLWLLEKAVASGPRDVSPPWRLTVLPDLLLTVFAQGHSMITAMHFSRVAVSSLQYSGSAPNTWRELFWLTDGTWQGPLGIVTVTYQTLRLRIRTSITYVVFATTCMVALVTPVVLTRAYSIQSIDVLQDVEIRPSTMSFTRMEHVDGYLQLGAGMGSWGTGLSILDIHNTSTFTPPNVTREGDPGDFFFAGDVRDAMTTLPGLRLEGRCTPVDSSSLDNTNVTLTFLAFCRDKFPVPPTASQKILSSGDLTIRLNLCNNASWASPFSINTTSISNVGYVYYNYSSTGGFAPGNALIQCDSRMSTGTAVVSGLNHTYISFSEQPLFNVSASTGGEPVLDPLFAVFYYLALPSAGALGPFVSDAEVRGLGFQAQTDSVSKDFVPPSPNDIATALWRAVSHVTTGTSILSRSNDTAYPATVPKTVSVYTRSTPFAIGAYALLGLWLMLLLGVTAWCFRPTFSASLDSYLTSRLIADRVDLVVGKPIGDADANPKLSALFDPVRSDGTRRY